MASPGYFAGYFASTFFSQPSARPLARSLRVQVMAGQRAMLVQSPLIRADRPAEASVYPQSPQPPGQNAGDGYGWQHDPAEPVGALHRRLGASKHRPAGVPGVVADCNIAPHRPGGKRLLGINERQALGDAVEPAACLACRRHEVRYLPAIAVVVAADRIADLYVRFVIGLQDHQPAARLVL